VETALTTAEESAELLDASEPSFPGLGAGVALAAARLEAGDPAAAAATLEGCLPRLPAVWRPGAHELLTRCELARGHEASAARAASSSGAAAVALGLPVAAVPADRAAAALALASGDAPRALSHASAAASTAEALGAPLEAATARLLAGEALVQAGRRDAAATELQRAAATFESCGAIARRDAAERALGKLGRRRARRTRRGTAAAGIGSLTGRELEIARLVTDRRTNAEIAETLYLSPKTVETHLRNVFHKLGVSSRVEVARAVERSERATRGGLHDSR
jgi:DNA-binding CsgD family transcriptional regulator